MVPCGPYASGPSAPRKSHPRCTCVAAVVKRRLNTSDLPAFLDANRLHTDHRAFSRDMDFPFLGTRTSPDLVKYRSPKWPADKPAQVIDVHWSGLQVQQYRTGRHYRGQRPYFGCPFCQRRTIKLYDSGFGLMCRTCANLRFKTQQIRRRAQLFIKAQKLRARLNAGQRTGRGVASETMGHAARNLSAALATTDAHRGRN